MPMRNEMKTNSVEYNRFQPCSTYNTVLFFFESKIRLENTNWNQNKNNVIYTISF